MRALVVAFIMSSVILAGCSSYDVHSDYDPSTDFLRYTSFAIKKDLDVPGDILEKESFTQQRVFSSIESALMNKGLRMVSIDEADLVILTYAGVQDKVDISTYGYSYGGYWGPYYGGYGGRSYSQQTVVNRYQEGTLHIDILDAKKKELVWKGSGTGVIGQARSPQEREANINEAVLEILDEFPPH